MYCERLSKLYQWVPSPFYIVDKFYSEPFIENFSTFEMKCFLTSYSISVGVFFDKGVKKNVRKIFLLYHIAGTALIDASCTYYFTNLTSYDLKAVIFGAFPMLMTTSKLIYLLLMFHLYPSIEKAMEFFVNDYSNTHLISATNSESDNHSTNKSSKVKKWVMVLSSAFIPCTIIAGNILFQFDPKNQTPNTFTKQTFFTKFFPMWCPFENTWAIVFLSFLQDVIVVPESLIFLFGSLSIFIAVIDMNDKYVTLFEKLKLLSNRAFEKIEMLENGLKELVEESSKRIVSNKIKWLEDERKATVDKFYEDFLPLVERFQQLQRTQLLLKKVLDTFCSVTYCFVFCMMIGFGFVAAEIFLEAKLDYEMIIKMSIWCCMSGAVWYMNCVVGDLFSKQNDSFAEEVYSMPWYHFSPTQRKTVFTLLSVIQKPMYLRALNLIRIKMDTFPDFLNSVYSYIQIMRTLQSVKFRST